MSISTVPFGSDVAALYWTPSSETTLGYVAQTSRNKGFAAHKFDDAPGALKTLRFCMKAGHMSVFEFALIVLRIECPIFVARQLMRYRAASYMERSLRYCAATTSRGAWELADPSEASAYTAIDAHEKLSLSRYYALVEDGERKELARAVLPLSTPTVFIMRVDLRELFHIFAERLTPHCQPETRAVVEQMRLEAERAFPFSIANWFELYHKE